jgi:hypothetical protein
MPGYAGLQTNLLTWIILAGVAAVWAISVRIVPGWKQDGWPSLLKSLFGFAWLGFGVDIVLRFSMLAYNAVEWGNNSLRLVAQPPDTVNLALVYCGIYWLFVSVGFAALARRATAGPLGWTRVFTVELVYAAAIPIALVCSVLFYLTDGPNRIPLALITPLTAMGYLYIVPASIAWWDHFRQPGTTWRVGSIHVLVLLPALVHGWRSPYRENLAPLFLIPLIAAVFAGRRPSLRKLVPGVVLCFLVFTSVVGAYRRVKWENVRPEEVAREIRTAGVVDWFTGSWGERMSRFHSFDSILLTVQLVPQARPYSGRNVLINPFIRGFVPRFIYGEKGMADAGEKFGAGIWSYDDPYTRDHGGAAIAPSMPGDLYDAGGVLYLVLGGLMWGGALGLLDGWKRHLPAFCGAAITALVATHCAMSVERDFDHSVAGLIQIFLLLIAVAGVIALARRRNPEFSFGLDPSLERSQA